MDTSSAVDVITTAPEVVDFSLLGLFLAADLVVKTVMIGLLAASIWSWAIIVDKSMLYGRYNRQMNNFERVFWSGQSLEDLYQQMQERPSAGLGAIFVAAMKEWKRSHEQSASSFIGVQTRMDKVLDVAIARESETLEKRLGFALYRPLWHGMGNYERLHPHRRGLVDQPHGCCGSHRRSAVRHGHRSPRRHPGGDRL